MSEPFGFRFILKNVVDKLKAQRRNPKIGITRKRCVRNAYACITHKHIDKLCGVLAVRNKLEKNKPGASRIRDMFFCCWTSLM